MKVGELARCLQVPYRDVRYALEHGAVLGPEPARPGKGVHRDLSPGDAFRLGVVLVFKRAGLSVPNARHVLYVMRRAVVLDRRNGDPFDPFDGRLQSSRRWVAEVGDLAAVRVLVSTGPLPGDRLVESQPWTDLRTLAKRPAGYRPLVTVRLDLTELAGRLCGCPGVFPSPAPAPPTCG